jgi:hypothetical protein
VYAKSDILQKLHINYPELVFVVQIESDEDKKQFETLNNKIRTLALDVNQVIEFDTLDEDLANIFQ